MLVTKVAGCGSGLVRQIVISQGDALVLISPGNEERFIEVEMLVISDRKIAIAKNVSELNLFSNVKFQNIPSIHKQNAI